MRRLRMDFLFGASDTVKTQSITRWGGGLFCKVIKVNMPNFTAAVTGTLAIKDCDGDQVYSKASIAKNAVTIDDTKTVPMEQSSDVSLTLSGAPTGSGGTVVVTFFLVS